MSKLRMPYQCLQRSGNLLVAARGSSIDSFSLQDYSLLSTWRFPPAQEPSNGRTSQEPTNKLPAENSESSVDIAVGAASSPPAKRRKLSDSEGSQKPGDEGKGKKKANNRSDAVASGLDAPAITALAATKGGRHVIAATNEDKSIRVFEHVFKQDGTHQLRSLSQRIMPKRPCALALTEDDATIIAADKFGDVYSLPLLFSESENQTAANGSSPSSQASGTTAPKPFVPAASDLTVHSQRNLKALENQKRQTNQPPEKSEPTFEHKLLLGHVSMLTDVVRVSFQGRSYIISADRDEHIRVSRGIPQAHIIEGFCLGHTEFVSRLCVPDERSNLLISGGGDDYLFVWNWLSGTLVSKVDLKAAVEVVMRDLETENHSSGPADHVKVAVSGISHVRLPGENGVEDIIIAISEGVPALFVFLLTPESHLNHIQTIRLPGNALAVVSISSTSSSTPSNDIVVSIDSIHKPGSTTDRRSDTDEPVDPLRLYRFQGRELVPVSTLQSGDGDEALENENQPGRLTNLLYNLENLRKRDGEAKEVE